MSERQMRKMISYKIENLNPKERAIVDDWANGQFNITQSLTNIIMHIVGFVGNADVMDFDIQKKLHISLGDTLKHHEPELRSDVEPVAKQIPKRRNLKDEFPEVDLFPDD